MHQTRAAIFSILLFLPLVLMADWVDGVEEALEIYDRLTPGEQSPAQFISDQAGKYSLPGHWQVFWLDEPVFGTRIFLAETGGTGQPDAPLVMMVHGLGQDGMRDWMGIVPALEVHYRVLLIDLPGFGNSPPPNRKLSPTRYAELLHFVKPYFSPEPIAVVGHSMGGAVVLRYAQLYPDDINQIALIDVAGVLQRTAFIKQSAIDRIPVDQQLVSGALLANVIGLQDLGNSLIEEIATWPDPTEWMGTSDLAWGATFGRYPNINAALGLIGENFSSAIYEQEKPVSILWGAEDLVSPPRTGRALVDNLPHGRLHVIAGAGHTPMSSHPTEVSAWLLNSLQTAPEPTPVSTAELPAVDRVYACTDETGGEVRGVYTRMVIQNCTGLVLDGVTTGEMMISDSVIALENTEILNTGLALEIDYSTVQMTAGRVHGLINVNNSRLDFAGVQLLQATPFQVGEESRLVISVSRAGHQRYIHADLVLTDARF